MMDFDQPSDDSLADPAFQAVLVSCLERLERGEQLDHDELLRAYPMHADALSKFLDDRNALRKIADDLRHSIPSGPPGIADRHLEQTIDSNPSGGPISMAGNRIRYIGEYEIIREIARGGMGVVFKARQQNLDRVVALKMLLAGELASSVDVERFQREARAAGRLKHPHIVPIHEIGEHEDHHFYTMDYVAGESLSERVRERTLSPQHAANLVSVVADAVQFAHDQGIVHRDLKPANILIDADGQPHVTDFGLAKLREHSGDNSRPGLTITGQILGTPSYMSPEQATGKQDHIGPASDVYGLGGILYASLTGRAPFVAESAVETIRMVLHDEPLSPRRINASVPRDLEQICLKCLHKHPKDRYASVGELANDLRRFIAGEPVDARPMPTLTRLYRWSDRNIGKFTAIAIAAVLLLPLVVFIGFGITLQRWPWPLLLFSYPLMLVLLAPYMLMMLANTSIARTKRMAGTTASDNQYSASVPLLLIGGILFAIAIGGYGWVLLNNGWAVPQGTRYLVVVAILGMGAIIRGFPGRN